MRLKVNNLKQRKCRHQLVNEYATPKLRLKKSLFLKNVFSLAKQPYD